MVTQPKTAPIDVTRATEVVRKARAAAQAEYDALQPKDKRPSTWERLVRKWAEADREGGEVSRVYFNEFDPKAAAWLRKLMKAGLIPQGDVDERSITDVQASDLVGYRACHFFAGVGGWGLALRLAGWPDDRPVWTGSCPCQPFSSAGKRKGKADDRHLWPDFFRLIDACRPPVVFGEQVVSSEVVGRADGTLPDGVDAAWFDGVCADLEGASYTVEAFDLPAACVGSPNIRQRLFWVADAGHGKCGWEGEQRPCRKGATEWDQKTVQPDRCRDASGLADRDRAGHEGSGIASADGAAQGERAHALDPLRGGPACRLADPGGERVRADGCGPDARTAGGDQGPRDQRERVRADAGDGRASGRLGDASGERLREKGCSSGPGELLANMPAGSVATRGMGDTGGERQQGDERRAGPGEEPVAPVPGRGLGFWDAFDLIPCRDGKARRVEPGSFPLVAGVPKDVGPLLALLAELGHDPKAARQVIREARRNRVIRLRGYGNAIVPVLAARFIRAFMEAKHGTTKET